MSAIKENGDSLNMHEETSLEKEKRWIMEDNGYFIFFAHGIDNQRLKHEKMCMEWFSSHLSMMKYAPITIICG